MLHLLSLLLLTSAKVSIEPTDALRCAVVAVGDVDGDGVGDFAFAHRERPFGLGAEASEGWPAIDREPVIWVLSGAQGNVLRSFRGLGKFGSVVVAVGDLDGDQIIDLAVGCPSERGDRNGRVVLLSVGTGEVLATFESPKHVHNFGRGIAGGEQLVGDETADLLISGDGVVWVVDGATREPAEVMVPALGCRLHRQAAEGWAVPRLGIGEHIPTTDRGRFYFGASVGLVTDMDGDGLGEIAISGTIDTSCERWLPPHRIGDESECRTRVHFSAQRSSVLHLDSTAWRIVGAGDLDRDGVLDLVSSTVDEHTRAWSVGRRDLLWEQSYAGGNMRAEGTSLAFTGDHNGDGVDDLVSAANETGWDADRGFVSILSGASGESLAIWRVEFDEDPPPPSRAYGGLDAAPIGDIDCDGIEEIAVQIPVMQLVRVLRGKDLSVLWSLDVRQLPRPK